MAREPQNKTSGSFGRRFNQRVSKFTSKVDNYKTPLGLVVLATGAFLAYIAFVSTTGPPFQSAYQVQVEVPSDAPIMRRGQAVRVAGKLAGIVSEVSPNRETGGTTITANITKTEFRPLPEDTSAYVRVHSIVYTTYLELRPGESDGALETGDTLASEATSGVDLLEVVQLFDQQTREDFTDTLVNTGFGVAGRGPELNAALADVVPLSRNAASQLNAITSDPGALARVISGADRTASGLRGYGGDDFGAFIVAADSAVGTIAGRAPELGETIRLLRPFEDQFLATAPTATLLLNDLTGLSDELAPGISVLADELPGINDVLSNGDTLRLEVERIADAADPVLAAARPVVRGLYPTITVLQPVTDDLNNLVASVDPYLPELVQAGKNLSGATGVPFPQGMMPGAPAGRVVPVLTPADCYNPYPDPGEAIEDSC